LPFIHYHTKTNSRPLLSDPKHQYTHKTIGKASGRNLNQEQQGDMPTPSQHERIEIWRYTYARSSLIEAREAAKLLIKQQGLSDEIKRAIVYQVVVAYARPFTKSQVTESKRLVPLADEVVPAEFRDLHNEYIEMRDRTFGHKDAVAFPLAPLNKVIVQVDDLGFELHTVSPYTMLDTGLQRTVKLCDYLVNYCESEVHKYASHFIGIGKGVYILSVEANPSEWLLKKG
jgi:hypothetical protein